jgi:hypothetical protein
MDTFQEKLYQEVVSRFNNKEISGFRSNGQTYRLFVSAKSGAVCFLQPRSKKYGYQLRPEHCMGDMVFIETTVKDTDKTEYKLIEKWRKEALKATFTNYWIENALALPQTFEEWVADGKRSLVSYRLSTGTKIEGKIITLESFAAQYPGTGERVREAIKNKREFRSGRLPFRGYEATISIALTDNGGLEGHFALERKGTCNGQYYLLINDEKFIGYDID